MATGTLEVLDYSFSRIDHGYARARGVVGAMRYLYGNGKGLTAGEVALFRASGLKLGLNYEAGAGDFVGALAGAGHALASERFATTVGLGGNVVIFSADFDVRPSQFYAIGDALQAAMSVKGRGRVGIYGHANLIDYCYSRFGTACFYWQTYAWSGGRLSPHADLYQYLNGQTFAGGQVDFNDITGRTFWAVGGNTLTTSGVNAAPIEEDDMPYTELELAKIVHDSVVGVLRAPEFDDDDTANLIAEARIPAVGGPRKLGDVIHELQAEARQNKDVLAAILTKLGVTEVDVAAAATAAKAATSTAAAAPNQGGTFGKSSD